MIIQTSVENNVEIPYTAYHRRKNFEWFDWKHSLDDKFIPCTGISKWQKTKIIPEGIEILAEHESDPFVLFIIRRDNIEFHGNPLINCPKGLTETRRQRSQFLEDFASGEHKKYISGYYLVYGYKYE